MRGLKHAFQTDVDSRESLVALCTCAWIETRGRTAMRLVSRSHYALVRGLKHQQASCSLLLSGRTMHLCVDWNLLTIMYFYSCISRTMHLCVDWNTEEKGIGNANYRRTMHLCVDWNNITFLSVANYTCRTMHLCVDWNWCSWPHYYLFGRRTMHLCVDWNWSSVW